MGGMNIRNNIARIGATALIGCGLIATSVPATFAVEGAPQTVYTYADSAQFIAPDTWYEGQGLNIGGEGFKTADGTSGSVLALKLNKGAVKINGQDYLEIHADSMVTSPPPSPGRKSCTAAFPLTFTCCPAP